MAVVQGLLYLRVSLSTHGILPDAVSTQLLPEEGSIRSYQTPDFY